MGPDHWPLIKNALEAHGNVKETKIFTPPGNTNSKRWKQAVDSVGGEYVFVPRYTVGNKGPNDIAIAAHAALAGRRGMTVAMGVADGDFASLADILVKEGIDVIAVLNSGGRAGVARAFSNLEVPVLSISLPNRFKEARGARWKWVMQCNGSCVKQPLDDVLEDQSFDEDALRTKLLEAGYLESASDPVVPAVVKALLVHSKAPFVMWPWSMTVQHGIKLFAQRARLKQNNGKYIIVFPNLVSGFTKAQAEEYGTSSCAYFFRGGAPFVLQDTSTDDVIREFLVGLKYYNPECDEDLDEAIITFASMGLNKRTLVYLGLGFLPNLPPHAARACLHTALVSPKSNGIWKVGPRDEGVAEFLEARGFLWNANAQVATVHTALGKFLAARGLRHIPKNFSARLLALRRHLQAPTPNQRLELEE
mmetsp:Transcript_61082/g.133760  ORF Transcript_61082/g.133760 Transcript_61082/m.133760 type:complete len:420 (-) Transcript_61082:133-1392(-)